MVRNSVIILLFSWALILQSTCSKPDDDQLCAASSIVSATDHICLVFEHNGLSDVQRNIIASKVSAGMAAINSLMPINNLRIRIVEDPSIIIPEIGLGGFNPNGEEVMLAINTGFHDIAGTLEANFIPLLSHEVHHAKRRRSVGYGNTLLQAVVSEGLADHFSVEVTGIAPPPWSVALTTDELQAWTATASATWNQLSYNHAAWFFGADPTIPRWAGYAIGFELVNNYLLDHPDKRPSTLHTEPAGSFLP